MSSEAAPRRGPSRNPWVRDQESRPCRHPGCDAQPEQQCVTVSGLYNDRPHTERWNDAMAAKGLPFQPRQEGGWVRGMGPFPGRKPRREPPPSRYDPGVVAEVLNRPEVKDFIDDLEYRRWTGRPGYPLRSAVGALVVRDCYGLHSLAEAVRLIGRHEGLQEVLRGGEFSGLEDAGDVTPSGWACYRLERLLRDEPELLARYKEATWTRR